MSTVIRAEISENNKYWINKHRHYELKHFCLQYPIWKTAYDSFNGIRTSAIGEDVFVNDQPGDPTAKLALLRAYYAEKMDIVEKAAMKADKDLYSYILRAVTEGLSYTYLKSRLDIPCSRDTYYDRYRRFFWILNESRK